jgi:hypothetical protein
MNPTDKDTLQFILSATPEQLEEFYSSCDSKDLLYLLDLVDYEIGSLRLVEVEKLDEVTDVTQAVTFLKRFSLNK